MGLRAGLHQPSTQFRKLIDWIAGLLPKWRDDPDRPIATAEDLLSEHLCDFLNDEARNALGKEGFKFGREPQDDGDARRKVDISAKPSNCSIRIGDRHYGRYDTFLPIECKRLPTPSATDRDPREYVISDKSSTGGIQRFKLGHHGKNHQVAAMIGYVQAHDIPHWQTQIRNWICELIDARTPLWDTTDHLSLATHAAASGCAVLTSNHVRVGSLPNIDLSHLWIRM